MAQRVEMEEDEGSGFRGSVTPQKFWQIMVDNAAEFFALYGENSTKDTIKDKFIEIDEDFGAVFLED